MFYYTSYNPTSKDCFLICFDTSEEDWPQPLPMKEEEIVALVQLKGDELIWHKKGRDGSHYHFNEYLMKEDMRNFLELYFEGNGEGWEFHTSFPCVMSDSEVTYSWQSPRD